MIRGICLYSLCLCFMITLLCILIEYYICLFVDITLVIVYLVE